ncbi:MAG: low specificity L-threonine aldolase [Rhizobiaceae bacterium]|nr:low specificity L-threonine aldolase [Rhizobiaceae bacterium]
MFFASDNWAGAHPAVAKALGEAAAGFDPAYGSGDWDKRVSQRFSEIFEREVAVFFVSTGTAANSLSLSMAGRPGGVVFCHPEAHIREDECGAPEFFSGLRLHPVDGVLGKIDADALSKAIDRYPPCFVHGGRPVALSITQATEIGTLYALDEIDALGRLAKQSNLMLHMDGARFANALVALDCSPADMTWRRGLDMLSFGGTKNGCWCAEAVVLFDPSRAEEFAFHHKRGAQLFSKSRFVAAQFEAYLTDDLWLENARHANAMASLLADRLSSLPTARLAWKPQANEVFPILKKHTAARLQAEGAKFYDWPAPGWYGQPIDDDEMLCRFVTSFATREEDISQLLSLLG